MREQLHPLLGEESFAKQQNVSTTEIKDSIHPDIVMSLIDNFFQEQGFTEASKTLRSESGLLSLNNPICMVVSYSLFIVIHLFDYSVMTERLQPNDLLRLVRLGMTSELFLEPDLEDDDPELESLESYVAGKLPSPNATFLSITHVTSSLPPS